MEGPQPIKPERAGPTPIQPPLIELPHTVACSVTGGLIYHGHKFPELRGAYLFGDWETRRLWAARFEGDRVREMPEITRPTVRIVTFGTDQSGEIYFLDYDEGTVHTIERNDRGSQNSNFPRLLSQTGLFDSVSRYTPASGVIPFAINSPQWQDGATTERWIGLPGDSAATLYSEGKPVPGLVYWHSFRLHFPQNTVLMRTMSLGGRRVETQLLHFEAGDWRAYTYAWRDDQTDADLVPAEGAEREIAIGAEKRVWQFNNRNQCMSCHSNQSEYALAFVPEQLNRAGRDGRNQLIALSESGYLRRADDQDHPLPPFNTVTAAREETLADPSDSSQPLEARARAYLHANCGHCHSDHGGGAVPLRLKYPVKVGKMSAVDVRPTRGDFGFTDARIIKPGDPNSSTLFFRMAKFGRDRMPHLGAELPDQAALDLMESWIAGMKTPTGRMEPVTNDTTVEKSLDNLATALGASRKLQKMEPDERRKLLAAAANLQPGLVRDLFEGYLPAASKESRKLGSSPRPRTILALSGDASRGEKVFWSQAANCGSCHKISDRGTPVGPDLSTIGKLRSREDLLESILEPSRRIEPKYAAYVAHCSDGRAITGIVAQRDEKIVVLRDAQNKDVKLALKDLETLQPSRTSLMPQGQLAGMTAQEAADLLEYLVSRK
jgi:putative heme-binding domain-containing protein